MQSMQSYSPGLTSLYTSDRRASTAALARVFLRLYGGVSSIQTCTARDLMYLCTGATRHAAFVGAMHKVGSIRVEGFSSSDLWDPWSLQRRRMVRLLSKPVELMQIVVLPLCIVSHSSSTC